MSIVFGLAFSSRWTSPVRSHAPKSLCANGLPARSLPKVSSYRPRNLIHNHLEEWPNPITLSKPPSDGSLPEIMGWTGDPPLLERFARLVQTQPVVGTTLKIRVLGLDGVVLPPAHAADLVGIFPIQGVQSAAIAPLLAYWSELPDATVGGKRMTQNNVNAPAFFRYLACLIRSPCRELSPLRAQSGDFAIPTLGFSSRGGRMIRTARTVLVGVIAHAPVWGVSDVGDTARLGLIVGAAVAAPIKWRRLSEEATCRVHGVVLAHSHSGGTDKHRTLVSVFASTGARRDVLRDALPAAQPADRRRSGDAPAVLG